MGDATTLNDQQIKHLEMIQGVIGRLANGSFLIKGWAITVAGVFFGFTVNSENASLAVASILPTIAFWGLDTYFLRGERLFRALYDSVRTTPTEIEPFFMGATSGAFVDSLSGGQNPSSWWRTMVRPTLVLPYGALVASAAAIAFVVCHS